MTKAADPELWVRGLRGSWPVWLDRIPRRMRTHCTTTSSGDTGRVGVLLAGALLPGGVRLASRMGGVPEEDGACARLRARASEDGLGSPRAAGRRIQGTRAGNGRAATQERGARAGQRARWHRGFGR